METSASSELKQVGWGWGWWRLKSTGWILKRSTCNIMSLFAKYYIYLKKLKKEMP
jgi:hypothetical protein